MLILDVRARPSMPSWPYLIMLHLSPHQGQVPSPSPATGTPETASERQFAVHSFLLTASITWYGMIPVAPVAYQVVLEPGIGQFREFEPRRVPILV